MGLESLDKFKDGVISSVTANPITAAVGAAGAGAVLGVGAASIIGAVRKKKTKRRKTRNTRKRRVSRSRRKHKRRSPYTARKRKDRSHKRIRYTKSGQPYVIMRSGKARFIKKSSAKRSHKLKGGYY